MHTHEEKRQWERGHRPRFRVAPRRGRHGRRARCNRVRGPTALGTPTAREGTATGGQRGGAEVRISRVRRKGRHDKEYKEMGSRQAGQWHTPQKSTAAASDEGNHAPTTASKGEVAAWGPTSSASAAPPPLPSSAARNRASQDAERAATRGRAASRTAHRRAAGARRFEAKGSITLPRAGKKPRVSRHEEPQSSTTSGRKHERGVLVSLHAVHRVLRVTMGELF